MALVYRLWCPQYLTMGRVVLGSILEGDPHTVVVEPGKIEVAFEKLATLVKAKGKADCIEFHCHGLPAKLFIAAEPEEVNRGNVSRFGARLRSFVRTGGLIELLACEVARQTFDGSLNAMPQNIEGYNAEYHGSLQRALLGKRWSTQAPPVDTRGTASNGQRADIIVKYTGGASPAAPSDDSFGTNFKFTGSFALDPKASLKPAANEDGLKFCQELATSAAATVRAGIRVQHEEAWDGISKIGNWEGPVFDFHPGGNVTYLGMAPFRAESWKPGTTEVMFRKGLGRI
jgi:hypothetical protein